MDVYFYCNYANSKRGFLLTKLCADGLETASMFNSEDKGELMVDKFFSYDAFKLLWMDITEDNSVVFKPEVSKSFFGIRGLTGTISDRNGYLNIAFLAEKDESESLEYLVRGILYDLKSFTDKVFNALSVGGELGYELDTGKFEAIIDYTANISYDDFPIEIKSEGNTPRSLFKLGVYVNSWESASQDFEPNWIWKLKPKQAMDENTFRNLFR